MERIQLDPRRAAFFAFVGFGAFSVSDAFTRVLVHHDLSVFQVAATIQFFGVMLLLLAHKPLGHASSLWKSKHKKTHALRAMLFCISMPLNVYAFSILPFALVYSLLFTGSLWAILFSRFLIGEHIPPYKTAAVLCGLAGALVVLRPWQESFDWHVAIPLVSAMCYGVRSLLDRKLSATETPLAMACLSSFFSIPVLLLAALLLGQLHMPAVGDWQLFGIGSLFMACGMLCIPMAFRFAPITVVGPFHYTQLLWGAAIGALFFQQIPSVWTFAGGIIIVLSGLSVLLHRPENPPKT